GLQIFNVYRSGTLVQHIQSVVNPAAGRKGAVGHRGAIHPFSQLAKIIRSRDGGERKTKAETRRRDWAPSLLIPANSSPHQAADTIGDGLRIVARCPQDEVIEALEGTQAGHFVLAVQWHPERSFDDDPRSRSIFRALIQEAARK